MAAESNLYHAVCRYLDGLKSAGEPLEYRKVYGSVMGTRGEPDLDLCYHGQALKIELKAPGGSLTRLQAHRLSQWARAGAVTGVARSVADVGRLLKRARLRQPVSIAELEADIQRGSEAVTEATSDDKVRALCQFRGMLVIMEGKLAPGGGHCPNCGGTEFHDGPYGWVWCRGCEDFAVTKEHVNEL